MTCVYDKLNYIRDFRRLADVNEVSDVLSQKYKKINPSV